MYWAEKRGLKLLSAFRGYDRREVTTMMEFFSTMMDCLLLNMKRIFIQVLDYSSFAVQQSVGWRVVTPVSLTFYSTYAILNKAPFTPHCTMKIQLISGRCQTFSDNCRCDYFLVEFIL